MRRFGMALCALALLCQMLVFPVAADTAPDAAADTTVAPATSSKDGTYDKYVEDHPEGAAPAAVEVSAPSATQKDATVTVMDDGLYFSNETGAAT